MVFGDLNVNARPRGTGKEKEKEEELLNNFVEDTGEQYNKLFKEGVFKPVFDPVKPSFPSTKKSLDWALVVDKFASAVKVTVFETKPSGDDEEFVPQVGGKSDHKIIKIEVDESIIEQKPLPSGSGRKRKRRKSKRRRKKRQR